MKKETQIKMIKGALASSKTPKQFIPSLRRRLAKLTASAVILFAVVLAIPRTHAQTVSVAPATVNVHVISGATAAQVTPNNAAITCTPSALSPCGIINIGQSIHSITYIINGTCTNPTLDLRIDASNDGTHFFALSQDAVDIPTNPTSQATKSGGVTAVGSFPVYRVNLAAFSCTGGGSIDVWYSGTSTTTPPDSAIFQQANVGRQMLWQNIATNTALGSLQVSTPFENASGSVWIMCSTTCPAGMTVAVGALPLVNVSSPTSFSLSTLNIGAVSGWQKFDITDAPTNVLQLTVTGAGNGSVTWTGIYNFVPSTSQINGALNLNCLNGCFGSVTGVGDPCQSPAIIKSSTPVQTSTNVTIISGTASQKTFVCGYSLTLSGGVSQSMQFKSGTQTTNPCDTTATNLTGVFIPQDVSNGSLVQSAGGGYTIFTAPTGKDVCIFPDVAGPSVNGVVTYVKN